MELLQIITASIKLFSPRKAIHTITTHKWECMFFPVFTTTGHYWFSWKPNGQFHFPEWRSVRVSSDFQLSCFLCRFLLFLVSFFDSFVFPIKSMAHLEFIFTAYFGMRKNSNFFFFSKWKVSNLPIIYWRFPFFPQWLKLPSKILYESPLIMGQFQNSLFSPTNLLLSQELF